MDFICDCPGPRKQSMPVPWSIRDGHLLPRTEAFAMFAVLRPCHPAVRGPRSPCRWRRKKLRSASSVNGSCVSSGSFCAERRTRQVVGRPGCPTRQDSSPKGQGRSDEASRHLRVFLLELVIVSVWGFLASLTADCYTLTLTCYIFYVEDFQKCQSYQPKQPSETCT